jgi:NAD(P)-dependent dehydrogenase (short-subunit alcohol dehydrogenase family)
MKTILVTGANKGIGFEVSRQLASKGPRVILTGDADRLAKTARLENGNWKFVELPNFQFPISSFRQR